MMMMNRNVCSYFMVMIITLFIPSSVLVDAQSYLHYPSSVNGPKIWRITPSPEFDFKLDNITITPILVSGIFLCAFHCSPYWDNCLFAISIYNITSYVDLYRTYPQVVWSANRYNPIDRQVPLQFTPEGELILKDTNNTLVWSTGTVGKSVSRLNLSADGNLMLLDKTNRIVWQSFDHPTDSLVPGQRLFSGQRLAASVSPQNSSEGLYAFGIINGRFAAYMDPDPSQFYYKLVFKADHNFLGQYYAEFQTGSFGHFRVPDLAKFIQLGNDGHLKAYEWNSKNYDWIGADLLDIDRCSYPSACGSYGVCLDRGCNCPDVVTKSETPYFRPINSLNIEFGCDAVSPISCELSHDHHSFLQLPGYCWI